MGNESESKEPAHEEPILDTGANHAAPQKKKPSPQQADKIATQSHWKLPPSHTIDLGDVVAGRRTPVKFPIFYLGSGTGPRIESKLVGDPAIRMVNAPMSLPVASQPYTETNHFHVELKPENTGRLQSSLEIYIAQSPHEWHRYPVVADVHVAGMPTRKEEEQQDQRRRDDQKRNDEDAARRRKDGEDLDRYLEKDVHYHENALQLLYVARDDVKNGLKKVFEQRKIGITTAQAEIGKVVRRKGVDNLGFLLQLAEVALTIATAGIGAVIAKRLEPVVERMLTRVVFPVRGEGPNRQIPPSATFVAFFTESIKTSVKLLGGGAIDKAKGSGSGSGAPKTEDPMAAFFQAASTALVNDDEKQSQATSGKASLAVLPFFRSTPGADRLPVHAQKTLDDMHAVADGLRAEAQPAADIQTHETVRNWVRYLAHTNPDDPTARSNQGKSFDGLIDLTFSAMQADAQAPIKVTHIRFNGVRRAVMNRFIAEPLWMLGLPIRATCQFNPENSLIVTRGEYGAIRYTDIPEAAGSWFARRAGLNTRPNEVDREKGARLVMDEIASKSIATHSMAGGFTGMLENDSDES